MTAQFRAWLASRIAQQPVVCGAALCVLLVAATAIVDTAVFGARSRRVDSVEALQKFYRELGYVEPAVAAGKTDVPRVYLSHIPPWWRHIHPIATKKSVFFRALLPLVLTVNEDIARDRRRLQRIAAAYRATGSAGDAGDRAWLRRLATRYEVPGAADAALAPVIAALLRRVDTIPPSLALAQAAVESGYGVSRFAREANALYGQWRTGGGGVRPRDQPAHLTDFRVAAFRSPLASVAAYAHNLNTFASYRAFRALRAKQGRTGRNALALADTLAAYSARGEAYVATVQRIIEDNRLARFDGAHLGDGRAVTVDPR